MLSTAGITMNFGQKVLFENVSLKFIPGNSYGLIGANGTGKSTFLKILTGELEPATGQVVLVLSQIRYFNGFPHIKNEYFSPFPHGSRF